MKKRSIAALVAAMLVAVVGIFGSFFLSVFSGENDTAVITLPGQGTAQISVSPDLAQTNREKVESLTVDRSSVQSVIALLERPEVYQCQVETTYFYQNASAIWTSDLWKKGAQVRISQKSPGGAEGAQVLITGRWVYLWGPGEREYRRFPRQERDGDLYSHAPTYEDLLRLPGDQILSGEVREQDGHLCLYVQSQDPLTGELEEWYVLVENGLLLYASGQLEGKPTYQSAVRDCRLELDASADFTLPDGGLPEE